MSNRQTVAELVRQIADDIATYGGLGEDLDAAIDMLARAGMVPDVVSFLLAEAHRKRPAMDVVQAATVLLERALNELRLALNGRARGARDQLRAVHQAVTEGLLPAAPPGIVMLGLLRGFTLAGLEPPDALTQAILRSDDLAAGAGGMPDEPEDAAEALRDMADSLDHDPFAIFEEIGASSSILPAEQRAALAGALAGAPIESLREAALGFAFAADRDSGIAALAAIAEAAADLPSAAAASVQRLAARLHRMRPWLVPARQHAVDLALADIGGGSAPDAAQAPNPTAVMATISDGAGNTSVFVTLKAGRKHTLAGLLLKADGGVADVWVKPGLAKGELAGLMRSIVEDTGALSVGLDVVQRLLADALAVNLANDTPPPFGLIQFAETLGLGAVAPAPVTTAALIAEVLAGQPPARLAPASVAAAHQAARFWSDTMPPLNTWFEAGDEVGDLLRGLKTPKRRTEAVLTQLLPGSRAGWARKCAWAAVLLRESDAREDKHITMALIARDLAGDAPLAGIPFAVRIADITVAAAAASSRRR